MTDEEIAEIKLAETWVGENGFGSDCNNINSVDANREMVNAFLAGLKADRPEWHYVKSEKDLPTDNSEYLLLLEHGIRVFGYYNGKWWESWKGDLSWQEVKAYFFVPVPKESK